MHYQILRIVCLPAIVLASGLAQAGEPLHRRLCAAAAFVKVEGLGRENQPSEWTGSGVAVHRGGWVVTNRHVAPGDARTANTIRVVFNAGTPEEYSGPADVVLVHADRDLALLKCRLDKEPLTVPCGETTKLELTDAVWTVGFPLGKRVAANNANPTVSIVTGRISSLRRDDDGRLCWIDAAAAVAGGNSGSALVDEGGHLVGIVTRRYEGFARAVPVEFVRELLGEASLDVTFDPKVAGPSAGKVRVVVAPSGPVSKLVMGKAIVAGEKAGHALLFPTDNGELSGTLTLPTRDDGDSPWPISVRATAASGTIFERIVRLARSDDSRIPLRGTIHSVTLSPRKPNGWRWDADDPDPFCKVYVGSILAKQTPAVRNQIRFLDATEFDCTAGDRIRVVVYDQDIAKHDWAGEISFTAEPDETITRPTAGNLEACDITLRPVPLRPPVSK